MVAQRGRDSSATADKERGHAGAALITAEESSGFLLPPCSPVSTCHHHQAGRAEPKPCPEPRIMAHVRSGPATACFLLRRYTGTTGVSVVFPRTVVI